MSASNAMSVLLTSQNIKHTQESVPKTAEHFSKPQEYLKTAVHFSKFNNDL